MCIVHLHHHEPLGATKRVAAVGGDAWACCLQSGAYSQIPCHDLLVWVQREWGVHAGKCAYTTTPTHSHPPTHLLYPTRHQCIIHHTAHRLLQCIVSIRHVQQRCGAQHTPTCLLWDAVEWKLPGRCPAWGDCWVWVDDTGACGRGGGFVLWGVLMSVACLYKSLVVFVEGKRWRGACVVGKQQYMLVTCITHKIIGQPLRTHLQVFLTTSTPCNNINIPTTPHPPAACHSVSWYLPVKLLQCLLFL